METQEKLKYIAAELTEQEFKGLSELLKVTIQAQHQFLTELRFMEVPDCTCGNCDKDEVKKAHANMITSGEKGLNTLETLAKKLL